MTKPILVTLALSTALALSACGSQDNAEDHAASAAADQASIDANPFADLETQMREAMMAAVGTDVGDTWVRMMIAHHQGAIDMSRLMLQQNPSDHLAQMAQETIDKQTKEIEDLRKLVKDGTPNQDSVEPYRPAMTTMHQAMMSAMGADLEETFMRKMLAHHEGGVTLSEVALENGAAGAVRSHASRTRDGQKKEAEMVQAMLSGEPMPGSSATETSEASVSDPVARAGQDAPRPAPAASARPQPRATPAPAEAEDPHAGMDMSNQGD